MRLVWHVLKKDVRHRWPLLALFWAIVVVEMVAGMLLGRVESSAVATAVCIAWDTAPLVQFLLVLIIVPLVVQSEPPAGSTAFWLTRPISRSTVLVAKDLFIVVLLGLAPVVARLVALAAHGANTGQLLLAVPELLNGVLPALLVAALVAALSGSYVRYIVSIVFLVNVYMIFRMIRWHDWEAVLQSFVSLGRWDDLIAWMLMIPIACGLLAFQYMYRRTRWTIAFAVLSVSLTWIAAPWPSWLASDAEERAIDQTIVDTGMMELEITGLRTQEGWGGENAALAYVVLEGRISLSGMPEGIAFWPDSVSTKLQGRDGNLLYGVRQRSLWENREDKYAFHKGCLMDRSAVNAALGKKAVVNMRASKKDNRNCWLNLLWIPEGRYRDWQSLSPSLALELGLRIFRYNVAVAIPLSSRNIHRWTVETRIVSFSLQRDEIEVIVQETSPELMLVKGTEFEAFDRFLSVFRPETRAMNWLYMIVNRELGVAYRMRATTRDDHLSRRSPLNTRTVILRVDNKLNLGVNDSRDWIRGAELLVMEPVYLGHLRKQVIWEHALDRIVAVESFNTE